MRRSQARRMVKPSHCNRCPCYLHISLVGPMVHAPRAKPTRPMITHLLSLTGIEVMGTYVDGATLVVKAKLSVNMMSLTLEQVTSRFLDLSWLGFVFCPIY